MDGGTVDSAYVMGVGRHSVVSFFFYVKTAVERNGRKAMYHRPVEWYARVVPGLH